MGSTNLPAADDPLYETKQAAAYTHHTPEYYEKLRSAGGGPEYAKLGRTVRYRKSALDRWIAANTVRASNSAPKKKPVEPSAGTDKPVHEDA